MPLPNPGSEHGVVHLTDQTIDTRVTNGTRPYVYVTTSTSDVAGSATANTYTSVTGLTAISFTAVENHLYKYTYVGHYYGSSAGDTIRFRLTDGSNVATGTPSSADFVAHAATTAQSCTFITYEKFTTTQLVTRKIRFTKSAGGASAPHAFADSATGRIHMVLVEDCGVIVPT